VRNQKTIEAFITLTLKTTMLQILYCVCREARKRG